MSLWVNPIIFLKKHIPEGTTQQFKLCIDCKTLNSLLPSLTPARCTKKGAFTLMPLPKIDDLFALLKIAKYCTTLHLHSGYYQIKLDKESVPKSVFTTIFSKFEFLRVPFGLSQGPDFFIHLIYNLFGLNKTSKKSRLRILIIPG